ncbi:MAG: phage integrase N-terminal SAM-like domain-containing protein [Acidimicrobiia bacterium]
MSEAEITTATEPDFDTLVALAPSWYRSLRARNRSPRTVQSYRLAVDQLIAFLHDAGMPTRAGAVKREHVEAFISHVLDTRAAATARQRFASLQQFFKWLEEEGEVERNPMGRMKPPTVDVPTSPILTDDELVALIKTARTIGPNKFETTRNEAIIRLFIDTGARLGEVAAM